MESPFFRLFQDAFLDVQGQYFEEKEKRKEKGVRQMLAG